LLFAALPRRRERTDQTSLNTCSNLSLACWPGEPKIERTKLASLREAAMEKRCQIETAISGFSQLVYEHENSFE
jgi:hypothetical protein